MEWSLSGRHLAWRWPPALTILSTNMVYLCVVNLIAGIPVAGTTLLLFNYLLEVCLDSDRTGYIAYYNVALAVVGFVSPEVGGGSLTRLA